MSELIGNTSKLTSQRPTGLTVIGTAFIIFGLLSIVGNGVRLISSPGWDAATLFRVLAIVIAVAQIMAGIGVLGLRAWAWPVSLVVAALIIAINIVGNVVLGTQAATVLATAAMGVIASVFIMFYLLRPSTRAFFRR